MKFACESCGKKYVLTDEKLAGKRNVRLKCRTCGHVIVVKQEGELVVAPIVGQSVRPPASLAPDPLPSEVPKAPMGGADSVAPAPNEAPPPPPPTEPDASSEPPAPPESSSTAPEASPKSEEAPVRAPEPGGTFPLPPVPPPPPPVEAPAAPTQNAAAPLAAKEAARSATAPAATSEPKGSRTQLIVIVGAVVMAALAAILIATC